MQYSHKPFLAYSLASVALMTAYHAVAVGDMIYKSSFQSISGMGTQLTPVQQSSEDIHPFANDLLHTGYVRDEDESIVGNVSAFASLLSNLTGSQIGGLGRGSGFGTDDSEGMGSAEMVVEFQLDEPMEFAMTGQLRVAPFSLGLNGSSAQLSLSGPQGIVFDIRLDEANPPDELGIVNFMGTDKIVGSLPAGSYQFKAITMGHGSEGLERCVDFEFTFGNLVSIPEPATRWLALGVCGVPFRLRRRRPPA